MLNKLARVANNPSYYAKKLYARMHPKFYGQSTPADIAKSPEDFVYKALDHDSTEESDAKNLVFTVTRDPHRYKKLLDASLFDRYSKYGLYNLLLGAAEYGCGNLELARLHFEQALAVKPSPFVWHCLGRAFTAMDRDQEAFDVLGRGVTAYPDSMLLKAEQATAAFSMGLIDEVKRIVAPALALFDEEREKTKKLKDELDRAIAQNLTERQSDGDIYDDKFAHDLWWDYNYCFRRYNHYQEGSAHISHLIRHHVGQLLDTVAKDCPAVIDFGVMCGTPNYQLAAKYPHIQHYGVDRQTLIKTLNEKLYPAPNLHFHDGSILDFLDAYKGKLEGGLLFHARTSVCCYPDFLKIMYAKCHAAGIKHIVGIEFMGLSKATMLFHDYNDPNHMSIALRSIMFIHNHVKMMEEAGYKVIAEKRYSRLGLTIDMGLCESQAYFHAVRK